MKTLSPVAILRKIRLDFFDISKSRSFNRVLAVTTCQFEGKELASYHTRENLVIYALRFVYDDCISSEC